MKAIAFLIGVQARDARWTLAAAAVLTAGGAAIAARAGARR